MTRRFPRRHFTLTSAERNDSPAARQIGFTTPIASPCRQHMLRAIGHRPSASEHRALGHTRRALFSANILLFTYTIPFILQRHPSAPAPREGRKRGPGSPAVCAPTADPAGSPPPTPARFMPRRRNAALLPCWEARPKSLFFFSLHVLEKKDFFFFSALVTRTRVFIHPCVGEPTCQTPSTYLCSARQLCSETDTLQTSSLKRQQAAASSKRQQAT